MNKSVSFTLQIGGVILLIGYCCLLRAEDNTHWFGGGVPPAFKTAKEGCDYFYSNEGGLAGLSSRYMPDHNSYVSDSAYKCAIADVYGNWAGDYFGMILSKTEICDNSTLFDYTVGQCRNTYQKGRPDDVNSCGMPSFERGNPVNIATGNKFQEEHDLVVGALNPIVINRYYNSADELWRHSYSTHLDINEGWITFVNYDGRETKFADGPNGYSSNAGRETLAKNGNSWIYISQQNIAMTFNDQGKMTSIRHLDGETQNIEYSGKDIIINNGLGIEARLSEDFLHQPMRVLAKNIEIGYEYSGGRLVKRTKVDSDETTTRLYHYEDARITNMKLLTGITDERGIRFATWGYDGSKKAILSEHAGGAQRATFTYDSDDSTTVTNEINNKITYRFQIFSGLKRIIAIGSEKSLNCPASNSTYTYNDRGQMLTKIDAQGVVTIFTYNERGLEVSRTEADGTASARTIKTEWDPTYFFPRKILEATRTTVYTYGSQGQKMSQQVLPN